MDLSLEDNDKYVAKWLSDAYCKKREAARIGRSCTKYFAPSMRIINMDISTFVSSVLAVFSSNKCIMLNSYSSILPFFHVRMIDHCINVMIAVLQISHWLRIRTTVGCLNNLNLVVISFIEICQHSVIDRNRSCDWEVPKSILLAAFSLRTFFLRSCEGSDNEFATGYNCGLLTLYRYLQLPSPLDCHHQIIKTSSASSECRFNYRVLFVNSGPSKLCENWKTWNV